MKESLIKTASSRIPEYDIIKGISILLVCIVHTGRPLYFWEYGFLFAFFFVSGATFRRKSFGNFLKSKLLRIYFPFVLANFAGYFIGKFFYGLSGYGGYGFSLREAAARIFTFQLAENIMSPCWFLLPLFLVVFLLWGLHTIFLKIKWKDEIILGIGLVVYLAGLMFRENLADVIWNKCAVLCVVCYGLFFSALGYYYHNHPKVREKVISGKFSPELFVAFVVVLNEIWQQGTFFLNVRYGEMSSRKLTIMVSLMGVYVIVYSARLLGKTTFLTNFFALLGRHSMAILFFHTISYSVVTFGLHLMAGRDYPPTWVFAYAGPKVSIANAVAGFVVPIVAAELYEYIKKRIRKQD